MEQSTINKPTIDSFKTLTIQSFLYILAHVPQVGPAD